MFEVSLSTDGRESARFALKRATLAAHDAIEATPPMRAMMGDAPDAACVATAIRAQAAVIAPIEAMLAEADGAVRALFADYAPRAALARADLARLGARAASPDEAPPRFDGPAAWLGFRYVVEGASLGGALIGRHLAEKSPHLPALGFFDPHGARRGAVWRGFCARIETLLADRDALAEASASAVAVFAALERNLEGRAA